MSFWKALFGSSGDDIPLTAPAIESFIRHQIPHGIQELLLKDAAGGVLVVRVVFDNWHRMESRSIRSTKELKELVLFMATIKDLPLSDAAPPVKRPQLSPSEIVFLEEHCPECAVGLAESVDDFIWVLPVGHKLDCIDCGATIAAATEDMTIKVERSSNTRLVAEPRAKASRR